MNIAIAGLCLSNVGARAISLDEASIQQLETVPGEGPCARLRSSGANPSRNLLDICARAVPVGAVSTAAGGGSAATATSPVNGLQEINEDNYSTKALGSWSIFVSAEGSSLDREQTEAEDGFDSDTSRFVLGGTYLIGNTTSFSGALNISTQEGDFNSGGDFEHDTTGLRILGSFRPSEKISLQFATLYDRVTTDRRRIANFSDTFEGVAVFAVNGNVDAAYDYDQLGLSAQTPYEINHGRLTLTPFIGLDWLNTDYGTYNENGNTGLEVTIHDDDTTSLQSSLGIQGNFAYTTDFGAFIPQFNITWRHEFENDSRDVDFSFVEDLNNIEFSYQTDELDANFFEVSAGGVFVFANGVQVFMHAQTMTGHDVFDSTVINAGMRFEL